MPHRSTIIALSVLASLLNLQAVEPKDSLLVKATPPTQAFNEQRPEYLHIKEVHIMREGTQRLNFTITFLGEIPKNPKESVSVYVGFDIDQDPATGGVSAHTANFGQDIGFFIYQNQGDSQFKVASNSVDFRGRERDIVISKLKVSGDTIQVSARSELFSMFDSFKFFVSASQRIFEKGKMISETQISTTPVTIF